MRTIKLAVCAALFAIAIAAPAEAGPCRYKPSTQGQVVWVPLFLGVSS